MNKLSIFTIIIISLINPVFAKIIETDDSSVIGQELQNLTPEDLATFDVNGVLFEPEDNVLKSENKWFVKNFFSTLRQNNPREADRLEGIMVLNYKPVLLDERIPEIIKDARERGMKVIALTSGSTGEIGSITSREDLRISRLKSLDIDFTGSFKLSRLFLERTDKEGSRIGRKDGVANDSIFKDGIIFTSRRPKGNILNIFLDKVDFLPKKIIHIDNSIDKISDVRRMCKSKNIEFVGIHYVKQYTNSVNRSFDKKTAEKKIEILKTKSLWLSDKVVHCLAHTGFDINYCRSQ